MNSRPSGNQHRFADQDNSQSVDSCDATETDQQSQGVHGPQTNIGGHVKGPVLSGRFDGPVSVKSGLDWEFLRPVSRIIQEHWLLWLIIIVVEGILLTLYLTFRHRYLIAPLVGIGAITLVVPILSGWYSVIKLERHTGWIVGGTLGLTLLLLGGISWQIEKIRNPAQELPRSFCIAVARFGERNHFQYSAVAQMVTDQVVSVLGSLSQEITEDNPTWSGVVVREIGLVTSSDEAQKRGREINADLVVWGQVVPLEKSEIAIHFEILEAPDRVTSPVFPAVLPATEASFQERGWTPAQGSEIEAYVSRQSEIIARFSLGLATYFDRNYAASANQFRRVAQMIDPDAVSTCGDITALQGQDIETRCQEEDTDLGLVYFYLGRSHQRMGELEAGECWLREAAACIPEDPAVPLSIAYGYNSMGEGSQVEDFARETIRAAENWLYSHPSDVWIDYDKGLAYLLLDQYGDAAEMFDSIVEQRPDFYIAYLSSGRAYLEAGEVDEAILRFERAVEIAREMDIDPSWGILALADAHYEREDYEEVERLYEAAVASAPDVDWMYFRLGSFQAERGNDLEAQIAFERMLEATYDKAWGHSMLGGILRQRGGLEEAIEHYHAALDYRPTDTLSRIYLAEVYGELGDFDSSFENYEVAMSQKPDLEYGYVSWGNTLMSSDSYTEAVDRYHQALALVPTDCIARLNLGQALEAIGRRDAALEEYRSILALPLQFCPSDIQQIAEERIETPLPPVPVPPKTLPGTSTPVPPDTPTPTSMPGPTPTSLASPAIMTPTPPSTPTSTFRSTATSTPTPSPTSYSVSTPFPPEPPTDTPIVAPTEVPTVVPTSTPLPPP